MRGVAFAGAGVTALNEDLLLLGGLSLFGVIWAFTALLGVPMARREWLQQASVDEQALFDWAVLGAVAATAGRVPFVWALGFWGLALAFGRFRGVWPALAMLPVVVLVGTGAVASTRAGVPWEVLTVGVVQPFSWLSAAVGAAALIGWAPAAWSRADPPHPGRSSLPWTAAGVSLLGGLGWLLLLATAWLTGTPIGLLVLLPVLACAAGITSDHPTRTAVGFALLGAASSLYFGDPVLRSFWWVFSLPFGLGIAAGLSAVRSRSWLAGLTAVVLCGAALLCWPGLPDTPWTAGAAALPWVVAVWWVGSSR